MKTNGNANKTLLLGGTNSYREQRVNNKGVSIKTEHQISQRRHSTEPLLILKLIHICIGGKNQVEIRSKM